VYHDVAAKFSFMIVYVADTHAHVQRQVSVVKMATMPGKCNTEEQRSVLRFLWAKGLSTEEIHEEMFPVYGGNCLSRKSIHYRVANISLMTKRLKRRCGRG
jgi:hypothetical protein